MPISWKTFTQPSSKMEKNVDAVYTYTSVVVDENADFSQTLLEYNKCPITALF